MIVSGGSGAPLLGVGDGLLTMVIPAFNAAATIERAVVSALASGAEKAIVVDDGSTDATFAVAQGSGAQVVRQENQGAGAARSVGLSRVATEFVMYLDADDCLIAEGVAAILSALQRVPDAVGVVGGYSVTGGSGQRRQVHCPWREGISTSSLLKRGYAPAPPASIVW